MLSAQEVLNKYRRLVWPKVQKYLTDPSYPSQFSVPPAYASIHQFHWQLVGEYPKRLGKYLRPTLVLLAAQAMGTDYKKALLTAAAMQMSEEWLLIHDDWEDNSLQRRGKSTLHRLFSPELAINAGDTLQLIMWKVLTDNFAVLDQDTALKVLNEFYIMLARTALGQTVEIKWTQDNKVNLTNADWYFIADGKTSYYTIAGPLRLGAIIAKATPRQLDKLTRFGQLLGRCFQLVDDILDLTSDFSGLKKQTGNDIYEGKRTIILGHLLRSATASDKRRLINILSKPRERKTAREVSWVIKKMDHCGSIDYGKSLAQKLKTQALAMFTSELKFLAQQPYRNQIESLTSFILERDR